MMVNQSSNRNSDAFNKEQFLATNPNVLRNQEKINEITARLTKALTSDDLVELKQIIIDCEIADPISGSKNWTDVRQFNLMFETLLGSTADGASKIYLRPETAQGIFANFKNVLDSTRVKIPFGIGQIGKSFRNEVTTKAFIFRTREFEQAEIEFFCEPGTDEEWYNHWKNFRFNWYVNLGIKKENLLQLLQLKIRNVDATAYHEANLWMEKIETNRKAGESTHSFARGFVDTNNLSLHEAVSFPNDWGFFDEYNSVDTFVAKRLLARVCNSEGIFIKI